MDNPSLLVVGAGLAGLTAAARAAELGLRVMVLEQGEGRYPCNSRYSGGILHLSYQDPAGPAPALAAGMRAVLGEEADAALIDATAGRAGQALDWLAAHGARFVKASAIPWHRWTLAPPRPLRPGFDHPGTGGDMLLERLANDLERRGGVIRRGAKAVSVARAGEGFRVGIATGDGHEVMVSPVLVIADGGFQGDREAIARHVTPRVDRIVQRGAGTGSGFALAAAAALNCRLAGVGPFYGHLLSRKALSEPGFNPYPQIDPVAAAGIVVGADGRRIADEGRGGVFLANALAALPDPASAFAVADAAIWQAASERALYPIAPYLEPAEGALIRAASLGELARAAGIDPDGLEATVAGYNRMAEGHGGTLAVPRSGMSAPIVTPPFVAIPLAPGITNTMGGIAVDASARALDKAGSPVKGLYAVGASAGGLEGGSRAGYVGGLMRAVTSGLAAAEHIAGPGARAARNPAPELDAAEAPPRVRPVILPLLVRHGLAFPLATGFVLAGAIALLGWSVAGPWALLAGAAAGLLGFALARAFTEIAAVILDLLTPG